MSDIVVKQVFKDLDFLGWYNTGELNYESDIQIHKQVSYSGIFFLTLFIVFVTLCNIAQFLAKEVPSKNTVLQLSTLCIDPSASKSQPLEPETLLGTIILLPLLLLLFADM